MASAAASGFDKKKIKEERKKGENLNDYYKVYLLGNWKYCV